MHPLSVERILSLIDGQVVGPVDTSAMMQGCVIDSRDVQNGDAFFALPGRHEHGCSFAESAQNAGAGLIVVDESQSSSCTVPHVSVPDASFALAQVAYHNRQATDALVVGVTGSVGKTTTRRMISSVLGMIFAGIESPRNFNNQLGVPLSLLELQDGDEFAVIEVGTSTPGEIEFLGSIVQPEMAVLTRIAPAHLAGLASLQAIQKEKAELLKAIRPDGVMFLNADDALVVQAASGINRTIRTFGLAEAADVRASSVEVTAGGLHFEVDGNDYTVPVFGRHHLTNALAAIAVGLEVGVPVESIQSGLASFRPQSGRCHVRFVGNWTVIDDTYNSSPTSVLGAVGAIEEYGECANRIIVLGDMLDLGEQASVLHYGIGAALAKSKTAHVLVTGEFSGDVVDGFLESRGGLGRISQFSSVEHLNQILGIIAGDGDAILVKGSRATQMERVVASLEAIDSSENTRRAA